MYQRPGPTSSVGEPLRRPGAAPNSSPSTLQGRQVRGAQRTGPRRSASSRARACAPPAARRRAGAGRAARSAPRPREPVERQPRQLDRCRGRAGRRRRSRGELGADGASARARRSRPAYEQRAAPDRERPGGAGVCATSAAALDVGRREQLDPPRAPPAGTATSRPPADGRRSRRAPPCRRPGAGRRSATASRLGTPCTGTPSASASVRAVTSPTRRPVNGAGPVPTTTAVSVGAVDPGLGEHLGDHRRRAARRAGAARVRACGKQGAVVVGERDGDGGGGVEGENGHGVSLPPGRVGQVDARPARTDSLHGHPPLPAPRRPRGRRRAAPPPRGRCR